MSVPGFVESVIKNRRDPASDLSLYLQIPMVLFEEDDPEFRRPQCGKVAQVGDALLRDLAACDWPWIHHVIHESGRSPLSFCQLWAGDGGCATPTHYDRNENFLAQVCGRKHVLLFDKSEVFNLYVHPVDHPLDRHCAPDLSKPDFEAYPNLRRARGTHVSLAPGEALYIPANTFHYVYQESPGADNLSLNFWFGDGNRGITDVLVGRGGPGADKDALVRSLTLGERRFYVHRILEMSAAQLAGPDWGAFLSAWAAGDTLDDEKRSLAASLEVELGDLLGGSQHVRPFLNDLTAHGRLRVESPPVVTAHDQAGIKTPPEDWSCALRRLLSRDRA